MSNPIVLDKIAQMPDSADAASLARALHQAQAAEQPAGPATAESRLACLESQVGRLQLYVSVLLHLVKARGIVNGTDLQNLVNLADLEDGVFDGQRAGDPRD